MTYLNNPGKPPTSARQHNSRANRRRRVLIGVLTWLFVAVMIALALGICAAVGLTITNDWKTP